MTAMVLVLAPLAVAEAQDRTWKQQIRPGEIDVPRGSIVIQNLDSVWTATGEVLEGVSIVIRDGIIRAIGPDVSVPDGAEVIDGSGLTAIPGIVDEHSHTAMDRSTNEGTTPISAEVRVMDALDPTDFDIYRALSGGVTTALILHGSANPIGGQAAIIKMRWGMDDPEQLLVEGAPQIIKFALGENVTQKNWDTPGRDRFPTSRAGVEALYDMAFQAAQEYRDTWQAYRRDRSSFAVPPRRDLRLETLVDVMEGRILVHAHSYRSDEIVMLMRVAERYGFKIDAFTHVLEGYKVADEMAEHGAAGSTFSDWWAYKLEAYDAIPYNAAVMHRHGVLTSLNSDIPWLQTFMVYEFNKPVKYGGIPKEEALRMLTLYPARQLHIEDKVGSIEVGKQGDIVLLNGDPFNAYSRVEKTIIDGILYYDLSRDAELRGEPVRSLPQPPAAPVATSPTTAQASSEPQAATEEPVASDGSNGAEEAPTIALVGATVHPVTGSTIDDGAVVMSGGHITYVGARGSADIAADAQTIELSGKHIYPGMIDPFTNIGMIEIGQVEASRDDREEGRYNPHLDALWAVHPQSVEIPVARANGITAVMSAPASGVVKGAGVVIQLAGDTPPRMAVKQNSVLVVELPSPKGEEWEEPKLEGERLEELVALFERATEFAAAPSYRTDPTAPFDANDWLRERTMLEALKPAVTGAMPVFFQVRSERDIRTLFLFLDKFPEVKAVVVGGDQAYRVAGELTERRIPVIVGSALRPTMDRDDAIEAGWANARILHAAGVKIAFSTQDYADVRNLPYHAARAVAFGLPRDAALRAVTLEPAEILGVGSEMGSIETGKRGDLIVTDGDPLQIVTTVERAFIGGREVSLETKQTRLYEEFKERH
jgi:imidazolonepropionase-like amidohydrolase